MILVVSVVVIVAIPPEVALTEVAEGDPSDAMVYEPFESEAGVIVRYDFNYSESNYGAFWATNETVGSSNYSTDCSSGIASLQEVSGSTSSNSCICVFGGVDLSRWAGFSDIGLEARVRARRSTLGENSPNFRIGIGQWEGADYWSSSRSWSGVIDTGWVLLDLVIPESALSEGVYWRLSWGFQDRSKDISYLGVDLDYLEFRGDVYPSDVVQEWRDRATTKPVTRSLVYDQGEDADLVGLSCISTVGHPSPATLGIVTDRLFDKISVVCVSLDPDTVVTPTSGLGPFQSRVVCYSLVDSVSISTTISRPSEREYDGEYITINEPIAGATSGLFSPHYILGLAAESLCLTPGVGEHLSLVNESVYSGSHSSTDHETRLTWNTSCVTFDYSNSIKHLGIWSLGEGSTSFLMETRQAWNLRNEGTSHITVVYEVVLKHVRAEYSAWWPVPTQVEERMTRYSITDTFDYSYTHAWLHTVDINAPLQNMVNISAGDNVVYIEPTLNGRDWYIVGATSAAANVTVLIAVNQTYVNDGVHNLTGYLISYWDAWGPMGSDYSGGLVCTVVLEPSCTYCCVQPLYD